MNYNKIKGNSKRLWSPTHKDLIRLRKYKYDYCLNINKNYI